MQNGPTLQPPCIGVCAAREPARWSFWDQDAAIVAGTYLEAVRRAGGVSLGLLPADLAPSEVEALVDRIDGLLLIGGADLDPASYGADRSPRTERTVPLRDRFELALVRAALARDIPVLAICRGLHVLNVAAGGTLHQHLGDEGYAEHRPAPGRLDGATSHGVEIEPGSLAADAVASLRTTVNSHHHQGVDRVGEGGRVTARSLPDGAIEAIEWPSQRYALGVQWHPEALELSATVAHFVAAAATAGAAVGAAA
jgi:putative glutamine amidotransferase